MFYVFLLPLIFALLISGCDSDDKLTGKREDIIVQERASMVESKEPVELDNVEKNTSWLQDTVDAFHNTPNLYTRDPKTIKKKWTAVLDYSDFGYWCVPCAPIVNKNSVFVIDAGARVHKIDAKNGKKIWSFDTSSGYKGGGAPGGITCDDQYIYVSTPFGDLIKARISDGKKIWVKKLECVSSGSPTLYNNVLYCLLDNNVTIAIDATTSKEKWRNIDDIENVKLFGNSSCMVHNNMLIVPGINGTLTFLDLNNGVLIGSESIIKTTNASDTFASIAQIRSAPVVSGGVVFANSYSGITCALELDGEFEKQWEVESGNTRCQIINGNSMFFVNFDNKLMCLDIDSGALKWSNTIAPISSGITIYGPLLTNNKLLLLCSNGTIVFVNAYNGKIEHVIKNSNINFEHPPVICDGTIYCISKEGKLLAFA